MALTLRPTDEQTEEIERLKLIFDVGTASRALLMAGKAYLVQRDVLKEVAKSHHILEAKFNRLVELELDKLAAVNAIEEIRDQGKFEFDFEIPPELDEMSKMILRDNVVQKGVHYSWR